MFIRCRNTLSGTEASIPVGLVETGALPVWEPIEGVEPSAMPGDPIYPTDPTPAPADPSGAPNPPQE